MSGGFRDLDIAKGYATGQYDLLNDFYLPCLEHATTYDRSAGFFRSSIFAVGTTAFSRFAVKGGQMRLICSPKITEEDASAITAGNFLQDTCESQFAKLIADFNEDELPLAAAEYFATFVASGSLEVRIAVRSDGFGMFHDKLGIFQDVQGDRVTFLGTANETPSAWLEKGNHENFEVFCSWDSGDAERISRHQKYFQDVWESRHPGLNVVPMPEGMSLICEELANERGISEAADRLIRRVEERRRKPWTGRERRGISPGYELQDHQKEAVRSWLENECRGIVKHATGAGKTVTGLEIIKTWLQERGSIVVAVPSALLLDQWTEEIENHFGHLEPLVLRVGGGSGETKWGPHVREISRKESTNPGVILGTIHSLTKESFLQKIAGGDHLLVVADEVHWVGAPTFRRLTEIDAGGRLGLSATPERFGDPEGTRKINEYFGDPVEPVITLGDAVGIGRLVPYEYHVHPLHLTDEEQEEWDNFSLSIGRAASEADEGDENASERLKMLLIRRARVLKKAEGKVDLPKQVMDHYSKPDQRWLIYCEDKEQLGKVVRSLKDGGYEPLTYYREMRSDDLEVMRYFENNPSILVAIKCLDEGVDIPAADAAVILASSKNPREFIQRRGRVLRRSKNKHHAFIHDALVLPSRVNDAAKTMPIVTGELKRALQFASDAMNAAVTHDLRALMRQFNIDAEEIAFDGFEEDQEEEALTWEMMG